MALPSGPRLPAPWQTLLWITRPVQFMESCRRDFGDIFTIRLNGLGVARSLVLVAQPDGIREVFGGDPDVMHAGSANAPLELLLGRRSLLLLDGGEHLRQRKLMLPPFHGRRMQAYESIMRDATLEQMRRWPQNRPFPILPEMQRITLEVILRAVFGVDDERRRNRMRVLLQRMLRAGSGRARLLAIAFARVELGGRTPWGAFMAARRVVDAALLEHIAIRRSQHPEGGGGDDVLSMLLDARDERGAPMTDLELRDQLLTLLIAGHETTATALAWTLDLLLHDPRQLAGVVADVDSGNTALLDSAIKESLRVRPVVPIVVRTLQRPTRIAGYDLPTGTFVAPCILLTQRRDDIYADPGRFAADRFVDHQVDPYAWLPFGGGVRRCLGGAFATFEMRTVLRTMLAEVRLAPARAALDDTTRRAVTLAPRHGVRVICTGARTLAPNRYRHAVHA